MGICFKGGGTDENIGILGIQKRKRKRNENKEACFVK